MSNVLDYDDIVSEFELQSRCFGLISLEKVPVV